MDRNKFKQKANQDLMIIKGLLNKYRKVELLEKDNSNFKRIRSSRKTGLLTYLLSIVKKIFSSD